MRTPSATSPTPGAPAEASAPPEEHCDVCIVGGGWTGLLVARHLLEDGLSVRIIEAREGIGGVWRYSEDPSVATVMASTVTSSSACVTEASDFPFDPALGNFLHHTDVLAYLHRYAEHFGLLPHLRFGRKVSRAERRGDHWEVEAGTLRLRARFLVVASGLHQRPRDQIDRLAGFTGETIHAMRLKQIRPEDFGPEARVLVYGGGESASDIVEQLVKSEAALSWSIPNGQHFFRKAYYFDRKGEGQYDRHDSALDEACSRAIQLVSPFESSKPGMRWLCVTGSRGTPLDYEGHGIPEWRKGVPFMHAMINKNGHVVEFVKSGRVTPRGPAARAEGDAVVFADGSRDTYTHVILCTGYRQEFPFLPQAQASRGVEDRYKLIFDPDEPSLAFAGYARPTAGSIPIMSEAQAFFITRVFRGQVQLPARDEMLRVIAEDRERRDRYFHRRRRPTGMVHCFAYGYDLARMGGYMPSYRRMLLEDPVSFFKTFFSPSNAALYRLSDPKTRKQAAEQMWQRQSKKYFVLPWIYLGARALQVDTLLELAHQLRFRLQTRRGGEGRGDAPEPA